MKAPPFIYHAPRSLDEALLMLRNLENPKIIAGGQSLMPMMNFRVVTPDHLIDLAQIEELKGINLSDDSLTIGAMTTQRTIQKSDIVGSECPLLHQALGHVGHQTTRNRGTIGGSVCHLDPAAELPLACLLLDPMVRCAGPNGIRHVPFNEFPIAHLTTSLEDDEILVGLEFPRALRGTLSAFEEFARRPGDFAIVAIAVLLVVDDEGIVRNARVGAGGIAPTPVRIVEAEEILLDQPLLPKSIEAAAAAAGAYPAEGEANYPAQYRQHLMKVLTYRALTKAGRKQPGVPHG